MSGLSVVVASGDAAVDAGPGIAALRAELTADDEIVWVGSGAVPRDVDTAVATQARGRGALYRAGLDAAGHSHVAFTDTATVVQPGWRRAAHARLAGGAEAVGGPVVPASTRPFHRFAGFVVEYGPHAVAPFASATGDVAANNVAYDRAALDAVLGPGEPVWKAAVDARLVADGGAVTVEPAMVVVSAKGYRWADLVAVRARHGRWYGAQQAALSPARRRVARAAAAAVVPLVSYARLARRLWPDRDLRRPFVLASPAVLLALAAWSAGEATGFCTAKGDPSAVF